MDINETLSNKRDALVERIKCVGQELIDRADSLVDEKLDWISDFDIFISFSEGAITEITTTTRVMCKNEHKMLMGQLTNNN